MNRHRSLAGLLLLGMAWTGCAEPKASKSEPEAEGAAGNGGSGPATAGPADPVDEGAGGGNNPVEAGGDGSVEPEAPGEPEPTEPFVIQNGRCQPNSIAAPEPIYESGHFNATINSVTGTSDEVFFSENSSFDEVPPRIARVGASGNVETLVDGRFDRLQVFGDTLYFAGTNELFALELTTSSDEPRVVMTVSGLLDYDERNVLFADADGAVWVAPLGAAQAEAGAVGAAGPAGDAGAGGSGADVGTGSGGPAGATLVIAERPWDVTLFGDTLYYTDGDTVLGVGIDGGEPTALFEPDSFNSITALGTDGTLVFFDNDDLMMTVPTGGGTPLGLGWAGPDRLFPDNAAFVQFLPGRDIVYWVDDGSSFGWTALDGQSCGRLGEYDSFYPARAHLTARELFVGGDSGLYRVARVD